MRIVLLLALAPLVFGTLAGCAQALAIDPAVAGEAGGRATGTFPDFRDTQRGATRQLTPASAARLERELAAERRRNERAGVRPSPRDVQAEAAATERRRLRRIRESGADD